MYRAAMLGEIYPESESTALPRGIKNIHELSNPIGHGAVLVISVTMDNLDIYQEFADDPGLANYFSYLDEGEFDIIAVLSRKDNMGAVSLGRLWGALQKIVAFQYLPDGDLVRGPGFLTWPVEDTKVRGIGDTFESFGVVRARVRREKPNMRGDTRFLILALLPLTEIPTSVRAGIDEIVAEYRLPVEISTDFGPFVFNRDLDVFEGSVPWNGREVNVLLEIDTDEPVTALTPHLDKKMRKGLKFLASATNNSEEFERDLRYFAATKLLKSANEWRDDVAESLEEEVPAPEITPEVFASRIRLEAIDIPAHGDVAFSFDDDYMFGGHGVEVEVRRNGNPHRAEMS